MTVAAIAMADMKVRASVIAGVDTPPVLEAPEHILDFVTLPVAGFVEASG